MGLKEYERKRRFAVTPEPRPGKSTHREPGEPLQYVIQKHQATALHYDFRLQWGGVLLSWAIPKGPSLDPSVKRLAMQTEDHPIEYAEFEGAIPAGEYGAGIVMLWDKGTWRPDDPDVEASLRKGELKFTLHGEKLQGSWVLVRTRGFGRDSGRSTWLLIKHRDEFASTADAEAESRRSVSTHRLLEDIARDEGGDVEKARRGDQASRPARSTSSKRSSGTKRRGRKV